MRRLFAALVFCSLVSAGSSGAQPFVEPPLVDNCNRTEEPLAGTAAQCPSPPCWTTDVVDHNSTLRANGTQCLRSAGSGNGSAWWNVQTFGPDMAIAMDVPDALTTAGAQLELYVRLRQLGDGTTDGYVCGFRPADGAISLLRLDNAMAAVSNVLLQNCPTLSAPITSGDKVACAIVGNTLTAYVWYGVSWVPECTDTDATYPAAGYGGWALTVTTIQVDNIRLGSLAGPAIGMRREGLMPIFP